MLLRSIGTNKYEVGHNYLFVPIPKRGENLRRAYTPTKSLGPSLTIDDVNDDRWVSVNVKRKMIGPVALFSRLFMHPECAFFTSPESPYLPDPDFVAIKYEQLLETFRRHFRIVSPLEFGITEPEIQMPVVPEWN